MSLYDAIMRTIDRTDIFDDQGWMEEWQKEDARNFAEQDTALLADWFRQWNGYYVSSYTTDSESQDELVYGICAYDLDQSREECVPGSELEIVVGPMEHWSLKSQAIRAVAQEVAEECETGNL